MPDSNYNKLLFIFFIVKHDNAITRNVAQHLSRLVKLFYLPFFSRGDNKQRNNGSNKQLT